MNTAILQKCIDELKKPRFSKDYVLGMLEALASTPEPVKVASTEGQTVFTPTAPTLTSQHTVSFRASEDPAGDVETPEQRKARLGARKVPPAFLGSIDRMGLDPAKTDGKTDVTPFS